MTVCTQKPLLGANDCSTWCLAKWDRSAATVTPNYFFIFCIFIKNSQKMAYIMDTLYIESIFEQIAETAKTISFSV